MGQSMTEKILREHLVDGSYTPGEEIGIKTAGRGGKELNAQPEFSDCLRAAKKKGVPVKTVCQKALQAYLDQESRRHKE